MKSALTPLVIFTITACFMISACAEKRSSSAAPLGEVSALEKLASSYRSVSAQLPIQAQKLPPKGKKEFVEKVFQDAGYNYSSTLIALSESKLDPFNEHQRDMAKLLFLPIDNLNSADYESLYEKQELMAIKEIRETFR